MNQIIVKLTAVVFFVFILFSANAQETWSLEKCIEHAATNNLQVLRSDIAVEQAKINEHQVKQQRYPSLSGAGSYSVNFGRSIDPTTNTFETKTLQGNNFSLNTGAPIYNGFQIKNTITQRSFDILSSQSEKEAIINNLALTVAQAYLQILLNEDQLKIAENRLETTKRQLERTNKLINAGQIAGVNRLPIEAQIYSDEQTIINAANLVQGAYLNLKTQLNLEADYDLKIVRPEAIVPEQYSLETLDLGTLYNNSLSYQPQIKANDYRIKSAEKAIEVAKGARQPSLTVFGALNTNYSDIAKKRTAVPTTTDIPVTFMGQTGIIEFPSQDIVAENYPYFNQLGDNFGQSLGLRLSVPIYNNGITNANIQRAELNRINADYTAKQAKLQLKADIQNTLANARAAEKEVKASEKTVEAQQLAYESTEKRFNLGAATSFEYTETKDNLDIAKANLVTAKYKLLFQLKALDFYAGKEITL